MPSEEVRVTILRNGPYLIGGQVPIEIVAIEADREGVSRSWRRVRAIASGERYALCRCGASATKPFCDGSHKSMGFDGDETAPRTPIGERSRRYHGSTLLLEDDESLCAYARFCDADGKIWNLIEQPDRPEIRETIENEAMSCPSGRLVVRDRRTEKALEPNFAPSIGLIEDLSLGCSGPIWVRGGIPIEAADGAAYERRNRVTLCRCGASKNKPFCDGAHADVKFNDGLE